MTKTLVWLTGASALAGCLLVLSGCATQDPSLGRARLELDQQRLELTKLRIELTKAALKRVREDSERERAKTQAQTQARNESAELKSATVAYLRTMAKDKGGRTGTELSRLADWVQAGGDPELAMRAALGGGLPR